MSCCSDPVPSCLSDVNLIPPCDRVLLEMAFSDLSQWAITSLRTSLLEAAACFKAKGIKPLPLSSNTKVYLEIWKCIFFGVKIIRQYIYTWK